MERLHRLALPPEIDGGAVGYSIAAKLTCNSCFISQVLICASKVIFQDYRHNILKIWTHFADRFKKGDHRDTSKVSASGTSYCDDERYGAAALDLESRLGAKLGGRRIIPRRRRTGDPADPDEQRTARRRIIRFRRNRHRA